MTLNPSHYIWDRIRHLDGTAISGKHIEDEVVKIFEEMGAKSASFHYPLPEGPFLGHICVSINDQVCHGVPNDRPIDWLTDVVNVDISFELGGLFYDTCRSMGSQPISKASKSLTREVVKRTLLERLTTKQIGRITQKLAKEMGYEVVPQFVGHGIGKHLHTRPAIPSVEVLGSDVFPFDVSESFTVEPIITDGKVFAQTEIQIFKHGINYSEKHIY